MAEIIARPSIEFKPYCNRCGAEIKEDVKIVHIFQKNEELIVPSYTMIHPIKCNRCGTFFEFVSIPSFKEETEIEDLKR